MRTPTDNALMLKVKSGELDKLGLLYERHKNRLFGFFFNMNADAKLSEDLVHNVFMRMLKYRDTFTGKGSFTAWMFTTARNVGYDDYRKRKKEPYQNDFTDQEYKIRDEDDFDADLDKKDDIAQLNRALRILSFDKREILILSKYKEIKFRDIGEILGCSEGAAKVKAHRALQDLRRIYLELQQN